MPTRTQIFYDRVAFLYPLINLFLKRQKSLLQQEVNRMPAGALLEIGVGNGSHLHLYRNHTLTGIDISEKMLDFARRAAPIGTILRQMDAHHLAFEAEQFDYIVLSHVLAVTQDPTQVLREAKRVLKPGGKLIILNHFSPPGILGNVDRWFQPIAARLHFSSTFELKSLKGLELFNLLSNQSIGRFSYYKLLILEKP